MKVFLEILACTLFIHSIVKLSNGGHEIQQESDKHLLHKMSRNSQLYHLDGELRLKTTKKPQSLNNSNDYSKHKRDDASKSSKDRGDEKKFREETHTTNYCFGYTGPPGVSGVQGIQGVPGVQGVQGLPGLPGQHGRPGHKGEPGRRGHKGDKGEPGAIHLSDESSEASHVRVAFSVTMDEDVLKSTEYRVLHFNVVHTNYGDNYDPSTGVFTTPINGTYLLGINGVSYNSQHILLHLVRNGQRMFSAFDSSGCSGYTLPQAATPSIRCSGSASNTGILSLERGDKVWVELPDGYGLHNALYHNYASFYGFIIYPGISSRK